MSTGLIARSRFVHLLGVTCTALALILPARAQAADPGTPDDEQAAAPDQKKPSPWLFAPVFSSNPKLGVTLGAMAGYLHFFDKESRPSMFAVNAQYSSTGSMVAAAFARTSFDADHQRLSAALV